MKRSAIDLSGDTVTAVRTASGERIEPSQVVIAAGRHAGRVAAMAGVPLPIEPRKRTVFVLRAPLDNVGKPLMFDTTGAWIRPEGEGFLAGISPTADHDPNPGEDFNPDIDQLEDTVWPALAIVFPRLSSYGWCAPGQVITICVCSTITR